jgi:hypothetical protein
MILTKAQGEIAVDQMIEPIAAQSGFTKVARLKYCQNKLLQTWTIVAHVRCPVPGDARFTLGTSIAFVELKRWLEPSMFSNAHCVGTPLHRLRNAGVFEEWQFSSAGDVQLYKEKVRHAIEAEALPFLTRYSNVDHVIQAVAVDDPNAWSPLGLDWMGRVVLHAAIHFSRGDRAAAEHAFDSGLAAMKHLRPVYTQNVEAARRYMLTEAEKDSHGA